MNNRDELAEVIDDNFDDYRPSFNEAGEIVGSNAAEAVRAAGYRKLAAGGRGMTISDEAVEAALTVLRRDDLWELSDEEEARLILEAAAPDIIAGYFREMNLKAIACEIETPLLSKRDHK